ncbi:titin isoform X2 [Drosophila ficusphila]|uniref:titin isoform X2 n=1 Tax=Drosophila ficusphila TaxID=30025 RepID=UPI001C8AB28A|nr:titin isoform X2 [Drosophila ficusphila]
MTTTSLPRVPEGLRDLMKVYTKEVLREKPADLYGFSANFFNMIVGEKSHQKVRKYEPVQTYETIMKNRIRQQVPVSLVFNIIPEKLTDLIKQFIKAVLKEKPENIYIFAQEYFQRMSKEKSGRIEYTKYSTYEKSLKEKENIHPVSKVTCECGRILSAKSKDVDNKASVYTDTNLAEADQKTFSSSITYLQSVVIIQRHFRRYLKQRNLGRQKDKCNSVEYMAAIVMIQKQIRRYLAKKRVDKLKNSCDAQKPHATFNTADYMKAVVVIQRHYRIYLKRKKEQNRLKNDPVSLATAAIIIQRAFRRMVERLRVKRNASLAADQVEELNDNASETGSYTSVSTALLSTESTELGMANYEERVHQKIIHEDEEVENNNVDAGLRKDSFAEPIKGEQKSMQLRKSEILSGALIENMITKPNLENIKDFNTDSKDLEGYGDIEYGKNKSSQDIEPEVVPKKASLDQESVIQTESKTETREDEVASEDKAEIESNKASLDETQDDLKAKMAIQETEPENIDEIKVENANTDCIEKEGSEINEIPNKMEKVESRESKEFETVTKDDQLDKKDSSTILSNETVLPPKTMSSEEVPMKTEVTPTVSIEIEHVDDILQDSTTTLQDANGETVPDTLNEDSVEEKSKSLPTDNLKMDSTKQESVEENTLEVSEDKIISTPMEISEEIITPTTIGKPDISAEKKSSNEHENTTSENIEEPLILVEKSSSVEHENTTSSKSRGKRSIEDEKIVEISSETPETKIDVDHVKSETDESLEPINQDETQMSNEQQLDLGVSSETTPAIEEDPEKPSGAKDETISGSVETVENNLQDPVENVAKASIEEIDLDESNLQDPVENVAKVSLEEITLDDAAKIDDSITEDKKISAESIELTDGKTQKEDATSKPGSAISSGKTHILKAEEKSGSMDDIEAGKRDLEPSTESTRNSEEESGEAVEETELVQTEVMKQSEEESAATDPKSLETEEVSSVEVESQHENLKNEHPKPTEEEHEDGSALKHINDGMGEIVISSTEVEKDPLRSSLEVELESSMHAVSEINQDFNEDDKDQPQQDMKKSIEDSVAAVGKISSLKSESSEAEDKQPDIENVLINSDSVDNYDSKIVDESKELVNISAKEEDSTEVEEKTMVIDPLPTEPETLEMEGSSLLDEQPIIENVPTNSESVGDNDSRVVDESTKLGNNSVKEQDSTEVVEKKLVKDPLPIESEAAEIENSTLVDEQPNIENVPTNSESVEDKVSTVVDESTKLDNTSLHNQDSSEVIEKTLVIEPSPIEPEVVKNEVSTLVKQSLELVTEAPGTTDKTNISVQEKSESTEPVSDLDKTEPNESLTVLLAEANSPNPETKPLEADASQEEQKDQSSDLEGSKPIGEDLKAKPDSEIPLNSERNSSLLVSNQLIGTQNLPTNHIEIEKNTKKLSSPSIKDKDIGTLTSGRLVPTPIAELQLKSFKNPNDDGAWYDIYVEPKVTSDKDFESSSSAVQTSKPDTDRQTSSIVEEPVIVSNRVLEKTLASVPTNKIVEEPIIAAERVPSYYMPMEIVEAAAPRAKNSVSFFVSFDSDDGKPKYKIPKRFRDDSKKDKHEEPVNDDINQSESEFDSNEEEIEVIEVSEGDPEYQPPSVSKLQTILEHDNENEQPIEGNDQSSDLKPKQPESPIKIIEKEEIRLEKVEPKILSEEKIQKTKDIDSEYYETLFKTDIIKLSRSVQIIEKAYKRFKNIRQELESDLKKQNEAARVIQKWFRSTLTKKSDLGSSDSTQKASQNLAAKKIQRAYRRYVEKTKESKSAKEKESLERTQKEEMAALIIQKAFRLYSQRNNDKLNKVQSSDNNELQQNQAAKKIQRAYRRYLKLSDRQENLRGRKSQEVFKSEDKEETIGESSMQKLLEIETPGEVNTPKEAESPEVIHGALQNEEQSSETIQGEIDSSQLANEPKGIQELKTDEFQEFENLSKVNMSPTHLSKPSENPEFDTELQDIQDPAEDSDSDPKSRQDLRAEELNDVEEVVETISQSRHIPKLAEEPKKIKELENVSQVSSSPIHSAELQSVDDPEILNEKQKEEFQAKDKPEEPIENVTAIHYEPEIKNEIQSDSLQLVEKTLGADLSPVVISNDKLEGKSSAALIIQRAFRQYMERKKLEMFEESSFDSITSSRITAIETSTPLASLVPETAEEPDGDASKTSTKSEWFVGSTRIVPSQGVVEDHLGVGTDSDPAEITSKTELHTGTQVESVEAVDDRTHGSLETKLTPGISSSKIDESLGSSFEKDNAVSSGLAGLADDSESGLGSVEDPLLLSQSDFGGIVKSLDMASTQELVNSFLLNEIEYASKQGSFLKKVKEEPCIKKTASLVNLSEAESELDIAGQKAENTDSSLSETTGLDTLSADTIDQATVKLSKPDEMIEKMSQLRDSKSQERIPSADPSFDESVVRPLSSMHEQYSLDIEDGDIIVYNRLQRDETRESSAQSDSVVFGEAEVGKTQDKDLLSEEESARVHLMRHYTIAGDDPRGLFRSVTIDDALNYEDNGEKDMLLNNAASFCLDDETSENIRKKMMAYSLSETDSDYFDPRKSSKEDFEVDTAMADAMGTSTETESTIVSAATKIQAGARGFLTRRRLRRASAGTKSSTLDTKASFGNDAISESLERFIEEEAAKKIQAAYRMHTRKRKGNNRKMEGISLESNLAARRQKLQRGDALRNDSTPDDENSVITSGGQVQKSSRILKSKTVGETKSNVDMELRWLKMRQNSMPVQIDCEVFRVIPKHMRKRIKSAEANKRK